MLKRTLWYACLVLLCCGISVLVVLATSATKTTLVPTAATSTASRAATDGLFSQSAPMTGTPVAKPQQPSEQERLRSDVPAPSTHLDVPEVVAVEKASEEARVSEAASRADEETKSEVQGEAAETERVETREVAPPEPEAPVDVTLRKELELQARAAGVARHLIPGLSDAELRDLVARSAHRTSEVRTNNSEKAVEATVAGAPEANKAVLEGPRSDEPAKLAELPRGPVALTQTVATPLISGEAGGNAPVFGSAGQSAGETLGGQEPEKVAVPAGEPVYAPIFETSGGAEGSVISGEADVLDEASDAGLKQAAAEAEELIARDQAGGTLTPADKEILRAYSRTLPVYENPRDRVTLDDNGGVTYVYAGATLRVPPGTGTGGGTDTTFAPITVSGSGGPILDVEVEIDSLYHSFLSDCDIFLRSPSGTTCELSTDNGGSVDSYYGHLRFDDDAANSITTATTGPVIGTYRPEAVLSVFDNQSAEGVWNLVVYDDANIDSGFLVSWRIQILAATGLYTNDYMTAGISSPAAGTTYAPSSLVTVTALFMNYGSAPQSSPVSYQFNAGGVVSEATASLAQYATENHSFATQITMPGTPGDYELVVWSDLGTDQDRSNDTLRRSVHVALDGYTCASVMGITTAGPDSTTYNNCGAGDTSPGQPCGASGADMVFSMVVADGEQGEIWQTSNAIDSRTTMAWSGACPGSNLINCLDDPDETLMRYVNHTGASATTYFTIGNYTIGGTCGDFKLAWKRVAATAYNLPYASGFETAPVPNSRTLPDFWSWENSNNDAYIWYNYNSGAYSGQYCAYKGSGAISDDWLFSPGLNLTNGSTYYVEYWRKAYSSTYPESLEVKVGTQNASSAMATTVVAWDSFKTTTWVKKYGTFTAGSTAPHYIGFHSYTRSASGGCYLDSLRVSQMLSNDFETQAITSPSGLQAPSGTANVTATFRNFGSVTQACSVRYQFNGGAVVSEATASLTALQTESHTFATQITMPGTVGTYPLVVWTDLATDENRANDTIRMNVFVNLSGWDCANAFIVNTAGPESLLFSNTGAGNNTPGQWCAGTSSYNDMVFSMTVPTDQQGEFWLTSTLTNYHSLKWGGACAGTTPIACISTSYPMQKLRYVNHTGLDQDIWFVIGGSSSTAGNYKLAWQRQATSTYSIPYANGFESPIVQPTNPTYHTFPNYWSIENSNGDAYAWENNTTSPYSGGNCARAYCGVATGNDDWLFTPGLDVTSGNAYYVEWWRKAYTSSYVESLEVKVGTSNTSAAMTTTVASWDSFKTTSWVKKYGAFVAGSTDTHYIGFHSYTRRSGAGGYLDSLRVVQMGSNDFRTLAITSPTSAAQAPGATVNVTATFQNFGSVTQACSVRYQFDGGTIVSEETPSLATIATDPHTFATQITLPVTPGTYPLVVWTDLATDENRLDDTVRMNVDVHWNGFACATAYPITTAGPDSLAFNNTGAGDNTPGQTASCYPTNSYADMVFSMDVPDGEQGEIWQTSGTPDFTQTLHWGSPCPGTNTIDCNDSPDEKQFRYVNHTGSTQTIYYTCGGYSSSGYGAFKLAWRRVTAASYTIPYTSSFEITVAPPLVPNYYSLPNYWSMENTNADKYVWENYNSGAYSGTYCARAYCGSATGNNDWLFSPGLILDDTSTYYLQYFRKAYSTTIPESLEVWIGTANTSSAMAASLVPWDTFKTNTWVQKGTTFTVSTPDTYYIGFHSYVRRSGGGCYLDSFNVWDGACGAPAVTVNSATGTTFVTLTATATGGWGGPLQYQWFTGVGCVNGNQIAGAVLPTYLATASGVYSARAWRADSVNCAACDSAEVTLSSPCGPIVPPYVENFDTTSNVWATCWSQVNSNSDATQWAPNTTTPLNGANCMYIAGTTSGNDDWLFSEPLSLTADTTYVLEYWRRSSSATLYDSMEVKFGGARLPAAMTNTLIAADTCKTTAYVLKSALFVPTTTGTYHIGFHSMSKSTSAGTRIDSVRVIKGICGAPTVTVNSATGTNFATLTAVASGGYGGALQYQWFTGLACANGSQIPYATGSTYLATASGVYSVRAWRRDSVTCAACDTATVTLSAACVATVPEYIENFDTTANVWSDCWSQENRNGDATAWVPSSTTPYSGTNCMYMAGTTAGNDDWLYSEPITLSSGTTYVLEYWRRSASSTYQDSLEVKYGTQRAFGAMLNTIFPVDTCKTTAYVQKFMTFTPSATATYFIGFHSLSNSSSAGTRIDSVHLYAFGPCAAPTMTVAGGGAVTFGSLLTANASGGHGGPMRYQWYTDAPPQVGNVIVGATSATYLAAVSDTYSCVVARGPVDSTQCSTWDSVVVAITCETASVPVYSQNFDGVTVPALPTCWSQENTNADAYYWITEDTLARSLPNCGYVRYNASAAMNDWLFSSPLQLASDTTYMFEYWYRARGLVESLEVKIGTYPSSAFMTTTLRPRFGFTTYTYLLDTMLFTPPTTGKYFVGWHGLSGSNKWEIYLDDIVIHAQGACKAPDSVRVAAGYGVDSVLLKSVVYDGWGGAPQYQWYNGISCEAGSEIAGATKDSVWVYATADYSCKVWYANSTTCAACDSAHARVITCPTFTDVPMSENFEGRPTPNLPYCWAQQNVDGNSYYWYTSTSYPHSPTKHAYIYTYAATGATVNDWLYSRGLQLNADTTYVIGYWYRAGSASYTEKMEVKAGRAQLADSMNVATLENEFTFNSTAYSYREAFFVPPTTGVYYIGWHAMSGNPSAYQYGYIYLDDVAFYKAGPCSPPDSVKVSSNTGQDSTTLRCTIYGGLGGPARYQWYNGAGCVNGNQISGAIADSVRVYSSGSYSCRTYRWDSLSCAGCATGTATVINCAAGFYCPLTEGFELVTVPALPTCWSEESFSAASDDWMTATTYPHSGTKSAYVSWDGSAPLDDWLYTPAMILSSDTVYVLDYWYRAYADTERMEIKYGTLPTATSQTNTIRAEWTFQNYTYVQDVQTFQPAVTDTYYIGFHATTWPNEYGIYMDDIKLYPQGYCQIDSVRANAAAGMMYAKLTANTYGLIGGLPSYQWYTGDACLSGNVITGATEQDYYATAGGLYSVKVTVAACTACDSVNATVTPDTCLPVSITPFTEGFESTTGTALPACWRYQDLGYVSYYWRTTTTTPHSGLRDAYMYGYSPTYVANDWMYTTPMVLQGGQSYTLGYWRRNSSSTYADSLEIKYGTIPVNTFMTYTAAAFNTNISTTWIYKESSFTPAQTDTYYVGFHCMNERYTSSAYTYIDDIGLWATGSCAAPTVTVTDTVVATGAAMLRAVVSGGYGGPPVYQWYNGYQCIPGNAIPGANASVYNACVSGIYACRVYMADSTTCAACDSGIATIGATPPLGYDCCTAIYLTGSGQSTWNNCRPDSMGTNSPGQSCGSSVHDRVFGLAVPANYTSRIHKTTNYSTSGDTTMDSRTSLMLDCGDLASTVGCVDDPDSTWWSYTNCTGAADTVFFIIGAYSTSSARMCSSYTIAWQTTQGSVCPDISCSPTVTESGTHQGCGLDGVFNTITCGDVVSGSLAATATTRGWDAYEMTITEAKNITVSVQAELDVIVRVLTDTVGTLCPDVYRDSLDNVACGTETRTFYNVPAGLVHLSVYPPYKETCGARDYCMTVTCATGTPPPGEDCSNPIVLTPPGPGGSTQVLGNNQGYVADYPDSCEYPGIKADVMYSLTISSCRRLTFSLDTSGSTAGNDKFIEVFESGQCGGNAFLCNDDRDDFTALVWEGVGQRPTEILGSFCGGELPAGTYYIRVSNASTGPGPYKLTVYDNGACPCDITCVGGDALETTESRYDTTFYRTDPDGGCLITPPAFGAINCGTTLCGVGFNYQRKTFTNHLNRDTDWYLFTIATRRIVTLTVNAEFPAIIGVVDTNNCLTPVAMFYDSAVAACTPTAVWDTLDPGTYAVAVAPRYFVGNPLPSQYRATLSCICIPGKKPTDVTCRFDSADATPIGNNYWNDIRIRWTADSAMAGVGTYTIYWNLNDTPYPGAGWAQLATGITPVLGPHATSYVDLNIVNATVLRRFYFVVAACE